MEVSELQAKKTKLENELNDFIRERLLEFIKETGVFTSSVYVSITDMHLITFSGDPFRSAPLLTTVEVKLDL